VRWIVDRRTFLKMLAATTLTAFGTPTAVAQKVFGKGGERKKLKDAVEELKDRPDDFLYLLSETFAQHNTGADIRLASAATSYYVAIGSNLTRLAQSARRHRHDPGIEPVLKSFHDQFLPTDDACIERVGKHPRLTIEALIISSVWLGITPLQQLARYYDEEAQAILEAYVRLHGNTMSLLELSDAEVVI